MTSTIFDARWNGPHGIGRFAAEVRARIDGDVTDLGGSHPVSPRGLLESEVAPHRAATNERNQTYFSPGYTPCLSWRGHHVFTIHDLIHLDVDTERSPVKQAYYSTVVKPAVRRERGAVLTVSEFSRQEISAWAGVDPERITVVGNGVDSSFSPDGERREMPWPYLLHVGNTKAHKNLDRLVEALATIPDVHLVCSSKPDSSLLSQAQTLGCGERLHFRSGIPESDLPGWYRSASAVVIPSIYEGFGLPAVEGMASGVPVVASGSTALKEVVADAGILVDPNDVDSIAAGVDLALTDTSTRNELAVLGPQRARSFSWESVAARVNAALSPERAR